MYALCKVQANLNYLHTYVSIVKKRTFLACTYASIDTEILVHILFLSHTILIRYIKFIQGSWNQQHLFYFISSICYFQYPRWNRTFELWINSMGHLANMICYTQPLTSSPCCISPGMHWPVAAEKLIDEIFSIFYLLLSSKVHK